MRPRRTAAIGLLLLVSATVRAAADEGVRVSASVDAREVPAGEGLQYTISVQGSGLSGVTPPVPSGLTNLRLVSGPNTSTSLSFVNGAVSSSKSFTWVLVPMARGPAKIPALDVRIGDKIYRTEPIDVSVTAPGSASRAPSVDRRLPRASSDPGPSELRLENEISADRVYVGQPIVLVTRLLTRVVVVDVSPGADPTLPGFLLEESETNVVPERVFREGREYQSYILMKRILTPTAPGKTVVPSETRAIRVRSSGRDTFESFFSPGVLTLSRSTAPLTIETLAPPAAGRPADFSGAVGAFRMQSVADRKEASVGEAVGWRITLTGTGNLKTIPHPALSPSADLRIFDPRIEETVSGVSPRSYAKTWNYVVTPLSPGSITLPTASFSYFDPQSRSYRTLTSSPSVLTVRKGDSVAPAGGPIAAGREVRTLQRDIRFLKPLDRPLRRREVPLHTRWWIWTVMGAMVLAQPVAWLAGRKGSLSALVLGGRRARARRRALHEIARAGSDTTDQARASSAASSAILRFLSERCGVASFGLTYEEMDRELGRRGVTRELREDLRSLLELCDQGRFAPESGRQGPAGDLLARARALVERLDREIGRAA